MQVSFFKCSTIAFILLIAGSMTAEAAQVVLSTDTPGEFQLQTQLSESSNLGIFSTFASAEDEEIDDEETQLRQARVPEPLTVLGSGAALGLGYALRRLKRKSH